MPFALIYTYVLPRVCDLLSRWDGTLYIHKHSSGHLEWLRIFVEAMLKHHMLPKLSKAVGRHTQDRCRTKGAVVYCYVPILHLALQETSDTPRSHLPQSKCDRRAPRGQPAPVEIEYRSGSEPYKLCWEAGPGSSRCQVVCVPLPPASPGPPRVTDMTYPKKASGQTRGGRRGL